MPEQNEPFMKPAPEAGRVFISTRKVRWRSERGWESEVSCRDFLPAPPGAVVPTCVGVELIQSDCLEWLSACPDSSIDHIYTDPTGGKETHARRQVDQGVNHSVAHGTLGVPDARGALPEFFAAAAKKLRSTGFLVVWCSIEDWNLLRGWSSDAGFDAQPWPITWVRTDVCLNPRTSRYFTRTTEVALLCAMPDARLARARGSCHWTGARDETERDFGSPSSKPLALHQWILSAIAPPPSTIVDPFAGCGDISWACVRSGYSIVAVEEDLARFMELQRAVNSAED
jgi:DNA modification methylase